MSASDGGIALEGGEALDGAAQSRKEKRKALKKQKRKQIRKELAIREREEEEARANDPEEQLRLRLREQEEAEATERERKAFDERERLWLEAAAALRAEEEQKEEEARRKRLLEESHEDEVRVEGELGEDDEWEYEEGPAEIIWKGNEIIVKKKQIRVRRGGVDNGLVEEADDRPTSNPLPPQSVAFEAFNSLPPASAQEALESVAQQVPNFGTEQDKAHCPFHLKTGACRFGMRCSRVHFYPDKSCTLLIKNMYNGPGIAWEQDEGLEYTDEEVERCYEEFYEDVHTEFLKFGELVNFKVCRNSSFHLRGNVYIHYKNLESTILAYNTMNGRYYAGKQVNCEFVNITRWKIAICGEFMKSRLKTCSHGTACNFIHCFHNPGGDYEWADWDNPPPRYWVKKMAVLFGPSDGPRQDMHLEPESRQLPRELRKKRMQKSDRYHSRRDGHSERAPSSSSDGDVSDENRDRHRSRDRYSSHRRSSYSRDRRKATDLADKLEQSLGDHLPEVDQEYSRDGYDSSDGMLKAKERVSSHKERKDKERNFINDHEEHDRKRRPRSRNRLTGKITVDALEKSERKSKHHGQRKKHDLLSSDSNHEVNDGNRKRSHLNDKASYKYVSDVDEQYSDRPSFVDLCSEKEFSHRRNMTSDFDGSNEGGESHRFPTSKHQSRHNKHDNETKHRKQEAKDKGLPPVESLDDWKKDVAESHKMHGKYVHGGRSGTRCRGELSLGRSEEGSCEHKDGV